jgi:hypothetical protein
VKNVRVQLPSSACKDSACLGRQRPVIDDIYVPDVPLKHANLVVAKIRIVNHQSNNSTKAKNIMKLHLNPILSFWIDVERDSRRNVMHEAKTEAIVQILREWEADGDAMRYVGQSGQICWKATPKFLDRLRDAELDAIEEFEAL